MTSNIIGIDISKDTIDCCLLIHNEPYYHKFNNSENDFAKLLKIYQSFKVDMIGFEATGNYHKKLEKYLFDNGISPYILNPKRVHSFAKSLPIHGKTDKTDSYIIALFLQKNDLRDYLSFPTREYFKPIITSLVLLEKQIRQNKNLIHSIDLYPETSELLDDVRDVSNYLSITKNRLEKRAIRLLYEKCPEAKEIKNEIAGVGDKLLLFLIPYVYDHFDKYTLKQINAFFGLNPVSFQSGTSVHKKDKLSHKGDKTVMKMLYMASVSAVRNNEILKEKYTRLKNSGKHSKVALVAVMSHLLRAIVIKLAQKTKREIKK